MPSSLSTIPLLTFILLCNLTPTKPASFLQLRELVNDLRRDLPVVGPCHGRADWEETPAEHLITLHVPGMKMAELKIAVDETRTLTVAGDRRCKEKKGDRWHRTQLHCGVFSSQFSLPENADLDTMKAVLKDGVLTVTISKLSPGKIVRPRTVSISGRNSAPEYKVKREL